MSHYFCRRGMPISVAIHFLNSFACKDKCSQLHQTNICGACVVRAANQLESYVCPRCIEVRHT